MNCFRILFATLAMIAGGHAASPSDIVLSEEQKTVGDKRWEPSTFATMSVEEVLREYGRYYNFYKSDASPEMNAEVAYQVGLNTAFRDWLPQYFAETPVLWENRRNRLGNLLLVSTIHSEWSVRLLMEISLDDRPMKSTQYNYDDKKWVDEMEKAALEMNGYAAEEFLKSMGLGSGIVGTNQGLARQRLAEMELAGAPDMNERQRLGISVADWLRQPGQKNRLPEILKATWGERVVLNADIGLGPDNKPLGADGKPRNSARPSRGNREGGAGEAIVDAAGVAESGHSIPWVPVAIAVGVLGVAAIVVMKKKQATS